jgi:hypothetical protein
MKIKGLDYDFGSVYRHLHKPYVAPYIVFHLNNIVNNN